MNGSSQVTQRLVPQGSLEACPPSGTGRYLFKTFLHLYQRWEERQEWATQRRRSLECFLLQSGHRPPSPWPLPLSLGQNPLCKELNLKTMLADLSSGQRCESSDLQGNLLSSYRGMPSSEGWISHRVCAGHMSDEAVEGRRTH